MNAMLDFICKGFAELSATGSKRKIQNEHVYLRGDSNLQPHVFQRVTPNHSDIGPVEELLLEF